MHILGGTLRNRTIKVPKTDKTRPTSSKVRKTLFDTLQQEIEGAHFLDLFAGSGAVGIEAFSRGATQIVFVEENRAAAATIRQNLATLAVVGKVIELQVNRAIRKLEAEGVKFHFIFLDPPYALDISPLLQMLPSLLAPGGAILLEQSKRSHLDPGSSLIQVDKRELGDTILYRYQT